MTDLPQRESSPVPTPPDVTYSVIVPARNAAATLGDQLEALAAEIADTACEVLVVDNGSTDSTVAVAERFRTRFANLRMVAARDGSGAAYARNQGAAEAAGDVLIFVDADDVVTPGWLAELTSAITDADLVGGNISSTTLRPGDTSVEPDWTEAPRLLQFLPWGITANLAVRRHVFDAVGGFDPSFARGEDVAFSWRAQLDGYRMVFAPRAVVRYRIRSDLGALWRQQFGNGLLVPHLYRAFRQDGARTDRIRRAVKEYLWVFANLPRAILRPEQRPSWVTRAALSSGRLVGSVRHRVFCL